MPHCSLGYLPLRSETSDNQSDFLKIYKFTNNTLLKGPLYKNYFIGGHMYSKLTLGSI